MFSGSVVKSFPPRSLIHPHHRVGRPSSTHMGIGHVVIYGSVFQSRRAWMCENSYQLPVFEERAKRADAGACAQNQPGRISLTFTSCNQREYSTGVQRRRGCRLFRKQLDVPVTWLVQSKSSLLLYYVLLSCIGTVTSMMRSKIPPHLCALLVMTDFTHHHTRATQSRIGLTRFQCCCGLCFRSKPTNHRH